MVTAVTELYDYLIFELPLRHLSFKLNGRAVRSSLSRPCSGAIVAPTDALGNPGTRSPVSRVTQQLLGLGSGRGGRVACLPAHLTANPALTVFIPEKSLYSRFQTLLAARASLRLYDPRGCTTSQRERREWLAGACRTNLPSGVPGIASLFLLIGPAPAPVPTAALIARTLFWDHSHPEQSLQVRARAQRRVPLQFRRSTLTANPWP
ncbi:hypothetical protein BC827DRAFT_1156806 [Russula dissimulans]|nr:hypothetical protein BC827DRAFT_1156806 [Russula dissimulans]